jgi:hypothetical protein
MVLWMGKPEEQAVKAQLVVRSKSLAEWSLESGKTEGETTMICITHKTTFGILRIVAFSIWLIATANKALAVDAPIVTPSNGTYHASQQVDMQAAPGVSIYYTLDGTSPTNQSTQFVSQFAVSKPTQLAAVAYDSQTQAYSDVVRRYLDVDPGFDSLAHPSLVLRLNSALGVSVGTGNPAPVIRWSDLSGLGNDATASVGHAPSVSTINSWRPMMQFDGATQYMNLPSGFADFTAGATIFVVAQPMSKASASILDLGNGATNDNLLLKVGTTNGIVQLATFSGANGTYADAGSAVEPGQVHVFQGVLTPNSPNAVGQVTVDFVSGIANNSMNSLANATRSSNSIAQSGSGTGNKFWGNISEVLVYNTALGSAQRDAIRMLLTKRYLLNRAAASMPVFTVPAGNLPGPTQVAIVSPPNCGVTRYTTDGTTPTVSSAQYTGPVTILHSQTIKAINIVDGVQSPVASVSYTLDPVNWPSPDPSDTTPLEFELQLPTNAVQP